MFLNLAHTKPDVIVVTREFVLCCYEQTHAFPTSEKFGMVSQIRRAALSVLLNLAEGCSRKSIAERKRFYEIARGSLIEVDTAMDLAVRLPYTSIENLALFGNLLTRTFQLISKMIT